MHWLYYSLLLGVVLCRPQDYSGNAGYEMPDMPDLSHEKPVKIFGEANEERAQEPLAEETAQSAHGNEIVSEEAPENKPADVPASDAVTSPPVINSEYPTPSESIQNSETTTVGTLEQKAPTVQATIDSNATLVDKELPTTEIKETQIENKAAVDSEKTSENTVAAEGTAEEVSESAVPFVADSMTTYGDEPVTPEAADAPAKAEAPAPEAPASEAPAPEAPAAETPAPEAPASEASAPEAPAAETPAPEAPTPAVEAPAPKIPASEYSSPETSPDAPVKEETKPENTQSAVAGDVQAENTEAPKSEASLTEAPEVSTVVEEATSPIDVASAASETPAEAPASESDTSDTTDEGTATEVPEIPIVPSEAPAPAVSSSESLPSVAPVNDAAASEYSVPVEEVTTPETIATLPHDAEETTVAVDVTETPVAAPSEALAVAGVSAPTENTADAPEALAPVADATVETSPASSEAAAEDKAESAPVSSETPADDAAAGYAPPAPDTVSDEKASEATSSAGSELASASPTSITSEETTSASTETKTEETKNEAPETNNVVADAQPAVETSDAPAPKAEKATAAPATAPQAPGTETEVKEEVKEETVELPATVQPPVPESGLQSIVENPVEVVNPPSPPSKVELKEATLPPYSSESTSTSSETTEVMETTESKESEKTTEEDKATEVTEASGDVEETTAAVVAENAHDEATQTEEGSGSTIESAETTSEVTAAAPIEGSGETPAITEKEAYTEAAPADAVNTPVAELVKDEEKPEATEAPEAASEAPKVEDVASEASVAADSEGSTETGKPTTWHYVLAPDEVTKTPEEEEKDEQEDKKLEEQSMKILTNDINHTTTEVDEMGSNGTNSFDEQAADAYFAGNSVEPSGYSMEKEPTTVVSPDLPPTKPEDAVGYDGIAPEPTTPAAAPAADLPFDTSAVFDNSLKIVQKTETTTNKSGWRPYQMDCSIEVDDQGELCKDWAEGGLCQQHRATMFLFCRKTCLCTGPGR